ncbi:MAG: L-seryl-tRNA(Sec) selenium transferase, partial [Candidatus Binatia bacterium]
PLKRALRCGKLTLAALSAVLRVYRQSTDLARDLPALRALARPLDEIEAVGRDAVERLRAALGGEYDVDLVSSIAEVGSGALPTAELESRAVAIRHPTESADRLARRFRSADPPIFGRVHEGRFLLDLRTVFDPTTLVP